MPVFIEEFLYRGHEPGSDRAPAWHVNLGCVSEDELGQPTRTVKQLNMAQATEAGYALPAILAAINTDALAEIEASRIRISDLQAAAEEASATISSLGAEKTAGSARIEELNAALASVTEERTAADVAKGEAAAQLAAALKALAGSEAALAQVVQAHAAQAGEGDAPQAVG